MVFDNYQTCQISFHLFICYFLLKDLLVKVEGFQAEAQDALCDAIPDSDKLKRLLEAGKGIDIELPEIPKLKQVSRGSSMWL